ncbi:MAG: TRAP transporter substrate-binding protein, partial [Burkholderiaceae bacterium]
MKRKAIVSLFPLLIFSLGVLVTPSLNAQEIQERTIRFGHLNNPDHPVSFGVKRFSEIVAAKSAGKLKVKEFPSSTLGNEMQQQS